MATRLINYVGEQFSKTLDRPPRSVSRDKFTTFYNKRSRSPSARRTSLFFQVSLEITGGVRRAPLPSAGQGGCAPDTPRDFEEHLNNL